MDVTLELQEKDRKEVINAYRNLMRACIDFTTKGERQMIREAFEYSLNAHQGARRKSGEPYILHPIAVARIVVSEMGLDATSVVCALLHDTVEDTFVELDDLKRTFNGEVARIIDGLTKISGVFDHKSSEQAENFRKMLLTLSDDIRVILIKLADRLHNMRTLQHMKKESQLKIASETLYLYAPLAHRLGLHEIKTELEDLALKYTEPTVFMQINLELTKVKRNNRYYVANFMNSIREKLKESKMEFTIKSRYKSVYSIYQKMKRQGVGLDEIYDLFAIRIILESHQEHEKTDCWKAYSLITELYKPNPERLRDWITIPKSNGYESLHVTVMGPRGKWIEVQVRTQRMDDAAERGLAAHWRYKDSGSKHEEAFVNWLGRVRDLLENPNLNAYDVVREFKTNLVTEEVFVFTPKGDLLKLPFGSSVVDFAYDIHTNIGNTCIGAKVNNKVVPLSTRLNNGDQVEIITSRKQTPKDEWLQYARTSKARHKIKEALRNEKKAFAEKGREIFKWGAAKFGITETSPLMEELLSYFKIPRRTDFFFLLGTHKLDSRKLQDFIRIKATGGNIEIEPSPEQRKRISDHKSFEEWLKDKRDMSSDSLVIGDDMKISDYKMSPCCTPIPGDDVIGFYKPEEGITIHRTNCQKAIHMMSTFGKNIIKARWTDRKDISFLSAIKIQGEDRKGMMNDLIRVMSNQFKLNIRSITIDSFDGMFEGVFKVYVTNTNQLEDLAKKLKTVSGVLAVSRVEKI